MYIKHNSCLSVCDVVRVHELITLADYYVVAWFTNGLIAIWLTHGSATRCLASSALKCCELVLVSNLQRKSGKDCITAAAARWRSTLQCSTAVGAALLLHPARVQLQATLANQHGCKGDAIMLKEQAAGGADQQSLGAFHEPLAGLFGVAQLSGHQRKSLVKVWVGRGPCCLDAL